MTGKLFNAKGGFTLVESVVAVMILGMALGACMLSFSMAMRTVGTASDQMAAMHFARDELESLRTNSFSAAALSAGGPYAFSNATFSGSYTVSNVDSATKNIAVSVAYINRIHRGFSTNTLTTSLVSSLHP